MGRVSVRLANLKQGLLTSGGNAWVVKLNRVAAGSCRRPAQRGGRARLPGPA